MPGAECLLCKWLAHLKPVFCMFLCSISISPVLEIYFSALPKYLFTECKFVVNSLFEYGKICCTSRHKCAYALFMKRCAVTILYNFFCDLFPGTSTISDCVDFSWEQIKPINVVCDCIFKSLGKTFAKYLAPRETLQAANSIINISRSSGCIYLNCRHLKGIINRALCIFHGKTQTYIICYKNKMIKGTFIINWKSRTKPHAEENISSHLLEEERIKLSGSVTYVLWDKFLRSSFISVKCSTF